MQLSADSVLINEKSILAESTPFYWGVVSDFFDPETYRKLSESFPTPDLMQLSPEGDKLRLRHLRDREQFDSVLESRPIWRDLFQAMQQQAFLESVHAAVEPALRRARGNAGARQFAGKEASLAAEDSQPVEIEFEFSVLRNGAFVPPHTDAPRKLVSLLLYFPPEDWNVSWQGHTEFYRPKKWRQNQNWYNRRADFEDLSLIGRAEFAPNQVGIFVKSRNSFHGVPVIDCPATAERRSVNVNIWQKYQTKSLARRAFDRGRSSVEGLINGL